MAGTQEPVLVSDVNNKAPGAPGCIGFEWGDLGIHGGQAPPNLVSIVGDQSTIAYNRPRLLIPCLYYSFVLTKFCKLLRFSSLICSCIARQNKRDIVAFNVLSKLNISPFHRK